MAQARGAESARARRADRGALPPLRAQLAQTAHLLAIYTGEPPGQRRPPAIALADLRLPEELPLTLPSTLARQRPDIRASEALLHRASAEIGVATADLYPQLTLAGSAVHAAARTVPDVLTNGINVWSIGASLLAPLFRAASCRRASARPRRRTTRRRRLSPDVLQGLQNVADVLRALEADARRIGGANRASVAAPSRPTGSPLEPISSGGVSQLALLDAERSGCRRKPSACRRPRTAIPIRRRCSRRWAAVGPAARGGAVR